MLRGRPTGQGAERCGVPVIPKLMAQIALDRVSYALIACPDGH